MNAPRGMGSFFRCFFASTAFFLAMFHASLAEAAPALRADFPCKGCLFLPPAEGATKAPLLVVLHGDAPGGKTPLVKRDSAPFVAAAIERGIAVLAPMCPKDKGCLVGSFWQWSQGDPPAWIALQIAAVRKEASIDSDRIWIAGWSGGASFLGYHYPRLAEHYAAVIFAGGGMPPAVNTCAPCSPPAYFLLGDKNPLHHLAKGLHESIHACTKDVTWDLLPGKDHGGEWRTFNDKSKIGELLDWLAKHPRNCPGTAQQPLAAPSTSTVIPVISSPPSVPRAVPIAPKAPSEKHDGCSVAYSGADRRDPWFVWAVVIGVLWRLRSKPS